MRYSKITGHLESPKRSRRASTGKWYDLNEFLDLKDVEEGDRPAAPRPPRVRDIDPLASSSDYVPHSLGQDLSDDTEDQNDDQDVNDTDDTDDLTEHSNEE